MWLFLISRKGIFPVQAHMDISVFKADLSVALYTIPELKQQLCLAKGHASLT